MADTYVNTIASSEQICSLMRRINALEDSVTSSHSLGDYITQFGLRSASSNPSAGQISAGSIAGKACYGGYVWITDYASSFGSAYYINKFTEDGAYLSRFSSNAAATSPFDCVVDGVNIYTLCFAGGAGVVAKYDMSGVYVSSFTVSGSTSGCSYMETDGTYLYISDNIQDKVFKYTKAGVLSMSFGTSGAGAGEFTLPTGLCVDSVGNIFVCDRTRNRLIKFSSTGVYSSEYTITGPYDVCYDGHYLYVLNGNKVTAIDTSLSYVGEFTNATHVIGGQYIAVDSSGFVYPSVTDGANLYSAGKFAGSFSGTGIAQTEFHSYTTTTSTSLGTPDAGVSIPSLNGLNANGAGPIYQHITDMRTAIETLAPYFTNAITGNPFNFTASSADNLYYVAMGDRTAYGATGGAKYTWTRDAAALNGSRAYSIDIGEIKECVALLEAS